jgi:dynein heavy chain
MKTEWENVQFTFVAYRETGISILSAVDDIQVYVHQSIGMVVYRRIYMVF